MARSGPGQSPKTHAEAAYHCLRTDIRSGKLAPGSRLRMAWVREQYGFGVSPLREALFRLSAENLVISEGQRGFQVAPISLADFSDTLKLRNRLEGDALEQSIAHGDDNWEARIVSCMHQLRKTPPIWKSDDPEMIEMRQRRHHNFHAALLSAAPSQWTLRFWNQLQEQIERYQRILLFQVELPPATAKKIERDHHRIMEAVLDRDIAQAIAYLRAHDTWSTDLVKSMLGEAERNGAGDAPGEPALGASISR